MELYTAQMAQWRAVARHQTHLLDTTTKTGIPAFAPGWDIVLPYKAGELSEEGYTSIYLERMQASQLADPTAWSHALAHPRVAVVCFCGAGKFCHRHLLVPLLIDFGQRNGIECVYIGEITAHGIEPNSRSSGSGASHPTTGA